jgi:L-fuconate dehydratase
MVCPSAASIPYPNALLRCPFPHVVDGRRHRRHVIFFHIKREYRLKSSRNTECDYSSAYITLKTDSDLVGHGMTFTIGRGNDIV